MKMYRFNSIFDRKFEENGQSGREATKAR
jgi:hypothetical protein